MARNRSVKGSLNYNNIEKTNKNFMYTNLGRSNCYNSNFSNSNFNFVSFRGSHFKLCKFYDCTFKWAEFIGTNLKGSNFSNAVFENTLFDSVNLDGVSFKDATFKNVIFLSTDASKAKDLNIKNLDIKVFDKMPELEISEELETAVRCAMENNHVKASRVLDTKDGTLNNLSLITLLENFNEKSLITGLKFVQNDLDRPFCTLSYIIKFLKDYQNKGLL